MSALRLIVAIGGPLARRGEIMRPAAGACNWYYLEEDHPMIATRRVARAPWCDRAIDGEAHAICSAAPVSTRRGYRFDRGIWRPRRCAPERARARAGAEARGRQTRRRRRSRADLPLAHGALRPPADEPRPFAACNRSAAGGPRGRGVRRPALAHSRLL